VGDAFKLYVAAQTNIISAVLTKEECGKEFTVANMSRRLLDAETRYAYIERLCMSLYYACMKFHHYILSSMCVVVCHHDVLKYTLHKPILSSRVGKWAYSLVEYDLVYEPQRAMKGQIIMDFIVDHSVDTALEACLVEVEPWMLFFDGSVCSKGQGVGCLIVSLNGVNFKLSVRLEFMCTNNQCEYEALHCGLEYLRDMGVRSANAFGDSNLVILQVKGERQYLDGVLNAYLDECLDMVKSLDTFHISHIPRKENEEANKLAQQASGYEIMEWMFLVKERPTPLSVFACSSEPVGESLVGPGPVDEG
jgi:ribonuclease HI